jgi:hypothetical protein
LELLRVQKPVSGNAFLRPDRESGCAVLPITRRTNRPFSTVVVDTGARVYFARGIATNNIARVAAAPVAVSWALRGRRKFSKFDILRELTTIWELFLE